MLGGILISPGHTFGPAASADESVLYPCLLVGQLNLFRRKHVIEMLYANAIIYG